MLDAEFIFEVGQWLRSEAVGPAAAFNGEVVMVGPEGERVVMRDSRGRRWARVRSQLSRIDAGEEANGE